MISISFILFFAAINCCWLFYVNTTFQKYIDITVDERFPGISISKRNGWTYSVSEMQYLRFVGNLCIENGNGNFLIVWPHLFSDNKYGFMLNHENTPYQFEINSNCELVNAELYSDEAVELFRDRIDEAKEMISALKEWETAANNKDTSYFEK